MRSAGKVLLAEGCSLLVAQENQKTTSDFGSADLKPLSLATLDSSPKGERARPQRRAFAESGAANAVSLYDSSHENGLQESPQTFL